MGFRSILRRVRKPAVMALVAGSLALSLTVTTTTKAEAVPGVAVAPVIAAAEGVLAGGVRLALPSLLSIAIATTPVGWVVAGGLAIGALGVGLYSTRDYWVPFVAGAFGAATANNDTLADTSNTNIAPIALMKLSPNWSTSGNGATGSWTFTGTQTGTGTFKIQIQLKCKNPTTGAIANKNWTLGPMNYGGNGQYMGSAVGPVTCTSASDTVVGLVAGAINSAPELGGVKYAGPANVIRWGTMVSGTGGFDPVGGDVKYKTTVECIDDGGNKSSISAEWFGDEGGMKVPSCAAAGKGHGTGKMSVEGYAPTAPGVPGTTATPVWDAQAPTSDPDHPLCGPQRPGPGCEMKIAIDGKPCAVGVWECENWTDIWKDPNTAPRVSCTFGPYTLAVSECTIMEPAYRPGGAPANEANMDGEPATRNYTQPGGTTYAPPASGTGTIPGGAAAGAPAGATPEQAQCFPQGWAMLNPVEWVMKPVGCALEAAFKPKKDLQTRLAGMQSQFSNKVPLSWFSVGTEGVSGGSCPADWAVTFEGHRYSLICGTEADNIIRGFRPVLGAMLTIAMLWPFIRSLFYAAIPVFKVTPS